MKRFLAIVIAATTLLTSMASAETRVYVGRGPSVYREEYRVIDDTGMRPWRDPYHRRHPRPEPYHPRQEHRGGDDDLAIGVIGLLGGMIIGSAIADNPPARHYSGGYQAPIIDARPWSRSWYRWCNNRYRSFDPDTGTYMGYDGERRFCRVVD